MRDDIEYATFNHPKNITVGRGRIIWARGATDTSGNPHLEGWVLPGGARTRNEVVARAAASAIDAMSPA
jgi:hypothetical protein